MKIILTYIDKQTPSNMYYVYALNLTDHCKFVGTAKSRAECNKKLSEHFHGRGGKFTKQHAPIDLNDLQLCPDQANALQVKARLIQHYNEYYGAENVDCSNMPPKKRKRPSQDEQEEQKDKTEEE